MTNLLRTAVIPALLGVIASAGLAAPASAVDRPGLARAASGAGVTVHRGSPGIAGLPGAPRDFDRDRFDRFDRDRDVDRIGYLGIPEYQGDSLWRPTGFNDWWHERRGRSDPRWLRANNCERQYWTGAGWRC